MGVDGSMIGCRDKYTVIQFNSPTSIPFLADPFLRRAVTSNPMDSKAIRFSCSTKVIVAGIKFENNAWKTKRREEMEMSYYEIMVPVDKRELEGI